MAAPLVVPTVCRFTINQTYAGRPVANVIDMSIQPATLEDREACIEDQAAIIVSAWCDEVLDVQANNTTATSVSWLDLNSELGSVGETSVGTGTDMPQSGLLDDAAMPGNVSIRVNKQTTALRGQRQGRMYLVGPVESISADATPNTISAGFVTSYNTRMAAFRSAVEQEAGFVSPSYDSFIVVVHTHVNKDVDPPVTVVEGWSAISGLLVDPTFGSQRRRLRG